MDKTDRVLDFILDLRISDIPNHVRHQVKRCFLDTLGALIAGTVTPVAQLTADFALRCFPGKECTVLANGSKASPVGASLANGYAANALDIDDGFRLTKGHPGACVLPVLLSAGEMTDRAPDGAELLSALVIGYEVAIRAGLIRHAVSSVYHTSGSWGAIGGAALAGRLLSLDRRSLREALGTAGYHAPIADMIKGVSKPCMAKDTVGWGAMVAISSALMAQSGFTAAEPLFDETPDDSLIDGLGREFKCLDLYFKPYCTCRWAQPAIAGALKVFRDHQLSLESITAIRVETFRAAAALSRSHPPDTEHAQYNLALPVAAALADGEVYPSQVLPPRIFDRDLLRLADMIEVSVRAEFEAAFPQKTIAEVSLSTSDGRKLSSGPMEPKWEPPDSLPSDEELQEKFHRLVMPVLGAEKSQKLAAQIWNLEQLCSIHDLVPLCLCLDSSHK